MFLFKRCHPSVHRGQRGAQISSFLHPLHRARTETPLTIQYGVTVSHGSYVKCCVKTETRGCHENALGSGLNSQNHKSGHLDKDVRTPSGHQCEWDLHPLWTVRSQSSDHPTLEPGCTKGRMQSPVDFRSTAHVLPLQLPGLRPTPPLHLQTQPVTMTFPQTLSLLTSIT